MKNIIHDHKSIQNKIIWLPQIIKPLVVLKAYPHLHPHDAIVGLDMCSIFNKVLKIAFQKYMLITAVLDIAFQKS